MEQKAHKAMRLSIPPDVHEWLWAEKGRTGKAMAEIAVEVLKSSMEGTAKPGRKALPRDSNAAAPVVPDSEDDFDARHSKLQSKYKPKAGKKRKGLR